MAEDGTLWLDYPSVGGPSPEPNIVATTALKSRYHHSLRIKNDDEKPWVSASMIEGMEHFRLADLKPGRYTVRLYFAAPDSDAASDSHVASDSGAGVHQQTVRLQGQTVLRDFEITKEAGGTMRGLCRDFPGIEIEHHLTLELSSSTGLTRISGIELIRQG